MHVKLMILIDDTEVCKVARRINKAIANTARIPRNKDSDTEGSYSQAILPSKLLRAMENACMAQRG